MNLIELVKNERVFAVIRTESAEDALKAAEACIAGGLKLIEITMTVPDSERVVSQLASRSRDFIVGVGSVVTLDMARKAIEAGAEFVVCPNTDSEIISYCKSQGIFISAAGLTPTEIMNAWKAGVDVVKVFPAWAVGGPGYIRYLKEPFPFVELMPTGGITIDNFIEYLEAGAAAVGLSSNLVHKEALKRRDFKIIEEKAREVVQKLKM